MAYWSRLVSGKYARFVMYKNITVCTEANKYLLLLLLLLLLQRTINLYRKDVHVHFWGHLCKKLILTCFISVLKLI